MIALMWAIHRHYRSVEDALTIDWPELQLKLRLFFRPNTVVIDVPYALDRAP